MSEKTTCEELEKSVKRLETETEDIHHLAKHKNGKWT